MEMQEIIDRYGRRRAEKEPALLDFLEGRGKPFLMVQRTSAKLFGPCNTVQSVVENNLAYLRQALSMEWTDDVPYLEPWIGTGVYANAFGCEYLWREDNAPDTRYRYHRVEEVRNIAYPDYRTSPIMRMVLECIDYLKEKTLGQVPICLTDTQSPFDTATLVLDAAELFTACYTEEETVLHLMDTITRLVIEFSRVQVGRIGAGLLARPGHSMPSSTAYRGISVSDDNLAVSSPQVNQRIALPLDRRIADAFGGIAIHSCGRWAHTMAKLRCPDGVLMIDCALLSSSDPTPNRPAEVRDAMRESGIITQVRVGSDAREVLPVLEQLFDPSLRLIVEIAYAPERAERNYKTVREKLDELYRT